jgi:phage baseplate assembly protein W
MFDIRMLTFENNILVPKVADTTVFLSGTPALVQRVIKCLLTVPGSDRFDPEFGVGVQNVLPKTYNEKLLSKNKMDVTGTIINAEKQIKEEDAQVKSPPSERLDQLYLRELRYDISKTQWVVDISLRAKDNTVANVSLGA